MRRPVKPFVTEYKGTNRRPGARGGGDDVFGAHPDGTPRAGGGESGARAENARVENARTDNARAEHTRAENAYEAAMKAADALFAPSSARGTDPGSDVAGSPVKDAPQADANEASSSGRRILRALDEPPLPEPAGSEASNLPKRRGRRPGSKNKPKPAIAVAALEPSGGGFDDEDPVEIDSDEGGRPPAPSRPTVPYRPRNGDRFAWVRTRLKPGEEWKRRLPKVCW